MSLHEVIIPDSVVSIGAGSFAGTELLYSINYNGTKLQWNQIVKEEYDWGGGDIEKWNTYSNISEVVCLDGTVRYGVAWIANNGVWGDKIPYSEEDNEITGDIVAQLYATGKNFEEGEYAGMPELEMIIEGTGDMPDLWNEGTMPVAWQVSNGDLPTSLVTKITICDGITNTPVEAFAGFMSLQEVVIPDSVVSIGAGSFAFAELLYSINYNGTKLQWKQIVKEEYDVGAAIIQWNFSNISEVVCLDGTIRYGVAWIANNGVWGAQISPYSEEDNEITGDIVAQLYETGRIIEEGEYAGMPELEMIIEGAGEMPDLFDVERDLPTSLVTKIIICDGITNIPREAFAGFMSLQEVVIPDSVVSIGAGSFGETELLYSINYNGTKSQWNQIVKEEYDWGGGDIEKWNTYSNISEVICLDGNMWCGPEISIDQYNRGLFGYTGEENEELVLQEYYEIEGTRYRLTEIGERAFYECYNLKSITISNSVKRIGERAFDRCTSISTITIPNSVITIGDSSFYGCTNLSTITIPNSVTTIGEWAFADCDNLSTITIPNSVMTIGDFSFSGCTNLSTIMIPRSVTQIGAYAFSESYNLTTINYAGTLEEWNSIRKDYVFDAYKEYGHITVNTADNQTIEGLYPECPVQ